MSATGRPPSRPAAPAAARNQRDDMKAGQAGLVISSVWRLSLSKSAHLALRRRQLRRRLLEQRGSRLDQQRVWLPPPERAPPAASGVTAARLPGDSRCLRDGDSGHMPPTPSPPSALSSWVRNQRDGMPVGQTGLAISLGPPPNPPDRAARAGRARQPHELELQRPAGVGDQLHRRAGQCARAGKAVCSSKKGSISEDEGLPFLAVRLYLHRGGEGQAGDRRAIHPGEHHACMAAISSQQGFSIGIARPPWILHGLQL